MPPFHSNDVIHLDELKQIMDDDLSLIKECFSEFIKEWPGHYVEIKGAILNKNAQELDEAAHRLKGTLKYLAAEPAANAAWILELAGKESNFDGIEQKLEMLKTECQKVVEFIHLFKVPD